VDHTALPDGALVMDTTALAQLHAALRDAGRPVDVEAVVRAEGTPPVAEVAYVLAAVRGEARECCGLTLNRWDVFPDDPPA
jgi:hypothetical protein